MSNGYALNALLKKKPNGEGGNYYIMSMEEKREDADVIDYIRIKLRTCKNSNVVEQVNDVFLRKVWGEYCEEVKRIEQFTPDMIRRIYEELEKQK